MLAHGHVIIVFLQGDTYIRRNLACSTAFAILEFSELWDAFALGRGSLKTINFH